LLSLLLRRCEAPPSLRHALAAADAVLAASAQQRVCMPHALAERLTASRGAHKRPAPLIACVHSHSVAAYVALLAALLGVALCLLCWRQPSAAATPQTALSVTYLRSELVTESEALGDISQLRGDSSLAAGVRGTAQRARSSIISLSGSLHRCACGCGVRRAALDVKSEVRRARRLTEGPGKHESKWQRSSTGRPVVRRVLDLDSVPRDGSPGTQGVLPGRGDELRQAEETSNELADCGY